MKKKTDDSTHNMKSQELRSAIRKKQIFRWIVGVIILMLVFSYVFWDVVTFFSVFGRSYKMESLERNFPVCSFGTPAPYFDFCLTGSGQVLADGAISGKDFDIKTARVQRVFLNEWNFGDIIGGFHASEDIYKNNIAAWIGVDYQSERRAVILCYILLQNNGDILIIQGAAGFKYGTMEPYCNFGNCFSLKRTGSEWDYLMGERVAYSETQD